MNYIELHCHSNFSFLDGASHPEDLVEAAAQLCYPALALTDHNGLYGIVRFNQVAQRKGVRPIFGAEITLDTGRHLVLLIKDEGGYANLSQLITAGQLPHEKGEARIGWEQLDKYREGLIALSGCGRGEIPTLLRRGETTAAAAAASRYGELFGGENFYLEMQNHHLPQQETVCDRLYALGKQLGLPCVATNNVHYARADGRRLQDVLTCIKHHTDLDAANGRLYPNGERYLKAPAEMARLFQAYPEAVANTQAIAERCRFVLNALPTSLPEFAILTGHTPHTYLREITYRGARERWGTILPAQRRQLEHELHLINKLDLSGYFLIVWDIARFCHEQAILAQGRGSAANSAVCYCLGITAVDPIKLKLLFERFLSEERREPPDIDIDIANNRREEVIQYVYNKYGRAHAAMVCEVICYRGRSAVRDVGKALGFSLEEVDRLAKLLHHYSSGDDVTAIIEEAKLNSGSARVGLLLELAQQIQDFPRHLGIHSGGMIVTGKPLSQVVPIENATMPERSVIQWDKDDAGEVGLVKIDLLGLGMLSLIDIAFKLIECQRGLKLDPAKLAYDDPRVYELLSKAETVGVFQVESRAQMNTLPRLQPRCFYDLVVEVALIRPGPIQGEMVHPYLRRRAGEEEVTYPHPSLKPILERTLGVPLFQEQGMQVAIAAAGFSPSQADELRRAMGHKRSRERMEAIALDLIEGMTRHGIEQEVAMRIYKQLTAFADYGFPESHAASFALLVYVSAYLKVYFAPEFYCALLNAQPMGFYSPASIVYEGQRREVTFLPVDLNRSSWDCTIEADVRAATTSTAEKLELRESSLAPDSVRSRMREKDAAGGESEGTQNEQPAVRLGYRYVKGLGADAQEIIERELARGPFASLEDFVYRTQLNRGALQQLAMVGAFDSFGITRRQAAWQIMALTGRSSQELRLPTPERGALLLPVMLPAEELIADFKGMDLSTTPHLMRFVRPQLAARGFKNSADLAQTPDRQRVQVAGIIVIRQRPGTAKGFLFITLEDEAGFINVVVKPQQVAQFGRIVTDGKALVVTGTVEKQDGVINVIGRDFRPLEFAFQDLAIKSRDFR